MKNLSYLLFLTLLFFYSCKKQNTIKELPFDKLYIFEYNFIYPEDYEPPKFKFWTAGFVELNKDFSLLYARALNYNGHYYYNSEEMVPDSLHDKISKILLNYPTDTTFLYTGEGPRIYDGNAYRFIMQKNNQKDITIKFEPKFLPEDLKFVYSFLYENRQKTEHRSKYDDLFRMFKDMVSDDTLKLPSIQLPSKIKFIPPKIIENE